jgi:CHAT domain-containing protein
VRGEGLRGLVQAFMVAGAPRVLATLWRVEDAPAAAFATKFHSLWKGRVAAAAALRETQDWMRTQTEKGWDHPRHWAPWVLWGLPN